MLIPLFASSGNGPKDTTLTRTQKAHNITTIITTTKKITEQTALFIQNKQVEISDFQPSKIIKLQEKTVKCNEGSGTPFLLWPIQTFGCFDRIQYFFCTHMTNDSDGSPTVYSKGVHTNFVQIVFLLHLNFPSQKKCCSFSQ